MLNHRLLEMSGFNELINNDQVSASSVYIVEIVEMPTACRGELSPCRLTRLLYLTETKMPEVFNRGGLFFYDFDFCIQLSWVFAGHHLVG